MPEPTYTWTGPALRLLLVSDTDGVQAVAAEVWRDCTGRWWGRLGCGCVYDGPDEEDVKLWLWDRREHGH
jgi:hypothetical protein